MASFAVLRVFVLAVLGATCVLGSIPDMGPCKTVQGVKTDFNFEKFVTANGGKWNYQYVPNLPFFNNIRSAVAQYTSTGTANVYEVSITNKKTDGSSQTFTSGRMTYLGNGVAELKATTQTVQSEQTYKYYFLYQDDHCVYYFVCSDQGADTTTDYRNMLVQQAANSAKKSQIKSMDSSKSFKNSLKELEVA